MSETVFISGNWKTSKRIYHTERCQMVRESDNMTEMRKDIAEAKYKHCEFCSGEREYNGAGNDLYQKLKQIGEANAD